MDAAPGGDPAASSLKFRVNALEQQAELADLKKQLDAATTLGQRQEQRLRQHRTSVRDLSHQLEELEQRVDGVQKRVENVSRSISRSAEAVGVQEKRGQQLDQLANSSSLKRGAASALSHGSPNSTRVSNSRADVKIEDKLEELERRLWQATQEFDRRLTEEAERRSAGHEEVLGVLGQGVQQLRSEQARHASELTENCRTEQRRVRQSINDSHAQHLEQQQHLERLESRMDTAIQALTFECQTLHKSLPRITHTSASELLGAEGDSSGRMRSTSSVRDEARPRRGAGALKPSSSLPSAEEGDASGRVRSSSLPPYPPQELRRARTASNAEEPAPISEAACHGRHSHHGQTHCPPSHHSHHSHHTLSTHNTHVTHGTHSTHSTHSTHRPHQTHQAHHSHTHPNYGIPAPPQPPPQHAWTHLATPLPPLPPPGPAGATWPAGVAAPRQLPGGLAPDAQCHHPDPDVMKRLEALECRFREDRRGHESPTSPRSPGTAPLEASLPESGRTNGVDVQAGRGLLPPAGLTVEPMLLGQHNGLSAVVTGGVWTTPDPPWKAQQQGAAASVTSWASALPASPASPRTPRPLAAGEAGQAVSGAAMVSMAEAHVGCKASAAAHVRQPSPSSPPLPWSPIGGSLTPTGIQQPGHQSPPSPSPSTPPQPALQAFSLRLPAPPGSLGRACFA